MSETRYTLKYTNGLYLPIRGREVVTISEVESMIMGLQATLARMKNGQAISDIAFGEDKATYDEIMMDATWLFNDDAMRYCYELYKPFTDVSGECVYFITSKLQPETIKIGSTINLFNRTKEHHQSRDCKQPVALAVVLVSQHRKLERLMHKKFVDHRIGGSKREWFKFQPVYDWLCHQYAAVQS